MRAALTLYGEVFWFSPYVFTVHVALREKGVEFETVPLALHEGEHQRPPYADRLPTGKVPAIEHHGFRLAESSAIVEYLEETFPPPAHRPLLPAGREERARARQVLAWIRSDLLALREERPTSSMFYPGPMPPLSAAGTAAADCLVRVADALIPDGATTLFGAWSIADADLAFMLHRLVLNGHPLPAKVAAFAAAQWARPSVREFVAHERPPRSALPA